jgi:tetratricopeptide (TPR) repeat protein
MLARYLAVIAGFLMLAQAAVAQSTVQPGAESVASQIARGDSAHTAMSPAFALAHYKAALAIDSMSYEALWKASRDAVDLGEFNPDEAQRKEYFAEGATYARRAVAAKPDDPEGHFVLARALGRVALTLGVKQQVNYAKDIRQQALQALKYDSLHPGALHVMGRWNAEIMRLSGFSRFFAKNFLGGDVFSQASWDRAVEYMEKSVKVDPDRLVHHLDLAEIYRDRNADGDRARAREQFELVINGKPLDYNDKFYKQQAEAEVKKL